jgi:hypothetical protein
MSNLKKFQSWNLNDRNKNGHRIGGLNYQNLISKLFSVPRKVLLKRDNVNHVTKFLKNLKISCLVIFYLKEIKMTLFFYFFTIYLMLHHLVVNSQWYL